MTQELTARAEVRQWMKAQIEGAGEVSLPELTNAALDRFAKDPAFLPRFFAETGRDVFYDIAQTVCASTRHAVVLGDVVTSRESVAKKARTKWAAWLEHAGDRHVHLLSMTREDLDLAIAERNQRIDHEVSVVSLLTELRKKVRANKTVADVFSVEEIDALYKKLQVQSEAA